MLYKYVFNNSKVVLLSKHLYYDIGKYISEEDVYYCLHGIPDTSFINKKNANQVFNKSNTVKLLFLSNMMVGNGICNLLDACKILVDYNLKFECTFVGGSADITRYDFLKIFKELGIYKNIRSVGKKLEDDKIPFFIAVEILVSQHIIIMKPMY